MRIMISNPSSLVVDFDFIKKIIKIVLTDQEEVSVVFIDEEEMIKFNKEYRRKRGPTDVLSFSQDEFRNQGINPDFLGEILICPAQVKKGAELGNISEQQEMAKVLIHGLLHLLGYNHGQSQKKTQRMTERENYYLSLIKFKT